MDGISSLECLEVGPSNVTERYKPNQTAHDKCLLNATASPYIHLLTKILVGLPQDGSCASCDGCDTTRPYNAQRRKFGDDWPPHGYTMTGLVRMQNFYSAMAEVDRNCIEGAIVELGVWRGGGMILAAAVQKERQMEHAKHGTPFI